jgi:hypothetical protein
MCGLGQWYAIYTVHITPFGYHHGHGVTVLAGGGLGDQYITTITIHTGDLTGVITLFAIATG